MVGSAMQKPEHAETKKPNIIFIMSDDVGFEEIGCYGVLDGKSITPHIDSLADNGVRFNICYAQAICGPSRAMLYTGNYAVNTGEYDNKLSFLPSDEETVSKRRAKQREFYTSLPCLTRIMKQGGYYVGWAGKWHHRPSLGGRFMNCLNFWVLIHISSTHLTPQCMKNFLVKS